MAEPKLPEGPLKGSVPPAPLSPPPLEPAQQAKARRTFRDVRREVFSSVASAYRRQKARYAASMAASADRRESRQAERDGAIMSAPVSPDDPALRVTRGDSARSRLSVYLAQRRQRRTLARAMKRFDAEIPNLEAGKVAEAAKPFGLTPAGVKDLEAGASRLSKEYGTTFMGRLRASRGALRRRVLLGAAAGYIGALQVPEYMAHRSLIVGERAQSSYEQVAGNLQTEIRHLESDLTRTDGARATPEQETIWRQELDHKRAQLEQHTRGRDSFMRSYKPGFAVEREIFHKYTPNLPLIPGPQKLPLGAKGAAAGAAVLGGIGLLGVATNRKKTSAVNRQISKVMKNDPNTRKARAEQRARAAREMAARRNAAKSASARARQARPRRK